MKKIIIKILQICFLIIFILQSISLASSTTTGLKSEQDENNKKINESKSDLDKIKSEKNENINQVNDLTSKISEYQGKLTSLNSKIKDLNQKIENSENEIEQAKKDYQEKEKLLQERLVAIYEAGDTSYLDVLLSSDTITNFISNYYLLSEITSYDEELLEEVQNKKNAIEESKKNLEVSKEQITSSKIEVETVSTELEEIKKEKNTHIAKLSEDEKNIQQQIDDLNQANQSIDAKIKASMLASLTSSSNKPINNSSNSHNDSSNLTDNNSSSSTTSTGFIKPVNSSVTTGMYYSSGQYHGAVDYGLSGINGSPVYAIGDGEVILAESMTTSYGNYIIIKHENGLFSLYAHGQSGSIRVTKNQKVTKGQQIMNVGSTGNSTGPHLHFEIREYPGLYSNRVNPLNYIPN